MISTLMMLVAATALQPSTHKVTAIVDGDTLAIEAPWSPFPNLTWKIRVAGVDTPEKGSRAQCPQEAALAMEATRLTTRLVRESNYRITVTRAVHDKYGGRFVAAVRLANGQSLAKQLIAAGVARPYDGGRKQSWCGNRNS